MKRVLAFAGVILITLIVTHLKRLPHNELWLDFLNVGQGDAILITEPGGKQILVDGGPEQNVLRELAEVMPFLDRTIDLVVLTHPHADHVMGLIQVLGRYEVGAVLITGVSYNNPIYDAFLEKLKMPIWIASGQEFQIGEAKFEVLYPRESLVSKEFENINNSSIVLKVSVDDFDVLLTGDAEHDVENLLMELDIEAEVLKAGHHGSRTASGIDFLKAVNPETVVIEVGADNQFDHPHKETLDNLESLGVRLYRTDLDGRVRIVYPGVLKVALVSELVRHLSVIFVNKVA